MDDTIRFWKNEGLLVSLMFLLPYVKNSLTKKTKTDIKIIYSA